MKLNLSAVVAKKLEAQQSYESAVVAKKLKAPQSYESAVVAKKLEALQSHESVVLSQSAKMSPSPVMQAKPVLQLNSFPVTLNPTDFANAKSNANPDGSLTSLFAFRELVDPIPSFVEYYSPNGASTEHVYGNVVKSANVIANATFTANALSDAKQVYEFNKFSNLDGTIGDWRPIYATPEDWYDVSQTGRFQTMEFDFSDDSSADSPYIILGNATSQPMKWFTANTQQEFKGSLESIKFKYLAVTLTRPWLSYEIFNLHGWYLGGEQTGYVSTGDEKQNTGILPLLPTVLLVGVDVQVTADWTSDDRQLIDKASSGNEIVSLGPFVLSAGTKSGGVGVSTGRTVSSSVLHVIGWLSHLIPMSPPLAAPD